MLESVIYNGGQLIEIREGEETVIIFDKDTVPMMRQFNQNNTNCIILSFGKKERREKKGEDEKCKGDGVIV